MSKRLNILTMEVNVINLNQAVELVTVWGRERRGRYVCVSNVHMCMETKDSEVFREVVNSADLVVADGKPIQLAQRLLGQKNAQQVRGMDLTEALCQRAMQEKIPVGFYGGAPEVLADMQSVLRQKYPTLNISYSYSPPFRLLEDCEKQAICQDVIAAQTGILFIGLGCPKQELWMSVHKDKLPCVMLGVGAVFDFIANHKKHAPRWMQLMALEWLFRLVLEPRRLWRRYLIQNPRFVFYFLWQYLSFLKRN